MPHSVPALPARLGKYRVTGLLGQGAMGIVYRAEDPDILRPVAIKTMHCAGRAGDAERESALQRFRNEAQAAGRLHHPGIVAVHEYGVDGDTAYIAMELVDGHPLSGGLGAGALPPADVVGLMLQLLDALAHAHAHGVWHRDIKPSNLMLTRDGRLKVTDFGIARIDERGLTREASLIGTPHCMAPEQFLGGPIDHRVDLWAAGVLMYQLLAGRQPFSGRPDVVMYQVLHQTPAPPSQAEGSGSPVLFDALVMQALSRRPEARPADATAFREALLALAGVPARGVPAGTLSDETVVRLLPVAGGGPLPCWDEGSLRELETRLLPELGPVARVLVRRAARECTDLPTLHGRLAGHLEDEGARRRFLAAGLSVGASRASAASAVLSGASGVWPDAERVRRAGRLLLPHLGPIAPVLAQREAARAASASVWLQALLARIDDPQVRAALERGLGPF